MTARRFPRPARTVAVLLALSLSVLGVPAVAGAAEEATADPADIGSYAPVGAENLTGGAVVTASSSYEMAGEGWSRAKLVDGVLAAPGAPNGWTTNPYDQVLDPATPAWVEASLRSASQVERVVLFPRSDVGSEPYGAYFPVEYAVTLLDATGEAVHTVHLTQAQRPAAPVVLDLDQPVTASGVRVDVSQRYSQDAPGGGTGNDGKLVQLSEVAVFGVPAEGTLEIGKPALLLEPGAVEELTYEASFGDAAPELVWSSSDEAVATVDRTGRVTAVGQGDATVTLAAPAAGRSATIAVEVADDVERAGDDFMITVFWPPTKDYVDETQYGYLADAGIDFVQNVHTGDLTDKATNLEMARLAHEHGMQVGVADHRFGPGLLNLTDAEIEDLVREYTNVPGVGGYYVLDEPYDPTPYARVFNAMKDAAPEYYHHLNFLPGFAYPSMAEYEEYMQRWVDQTGARDYLMYDRYPFGWAPGSLDYTSMLANMESVRRVGLANGVKTGLYLQSVGVVNNFRRTNEAELRYEANMSLAYGYKQLSYFTWWTPTNRGEDFTEAIMTATGKKTDLYEPVQRLNAEIHALGPTLMRLDAKEVYLHGRTWGQEPVPATFPVQSLTDDDLTFSYLRDRESGRNYVMVVNNSFTEAKDVRLRFDAAISSLQEVSRRSGDLVDVGLSDGVLERRLDKGEGVLLALPVSYDHEATPTPANTNLARGATVRASDSVGSGGWFARATTDGARFSDGGTLGWSTTTSDASRTARATVDLGRAQTVDRVDLYPAGNLLDRGATFPRDYTVDVSTDGETWRTVASASGQEPPSSGVTHAFDAAQARYVRVSVAAMNATDDGYAAALAEIEVFHDDAGTPPVEQPPAVPRPAPYVEGQNVARGKTVVVSSSTPDASHEQWGWSSKFLADGRTDNGWSSGLGRNARPEAVEWAAVALGATHDVSKVVLHPKGTFAVDYRVQVSLDGRRWTTVADVTGDDVSTAPRTFALDEPTPGAYVRVVSSRLRSGGRDGYLMQVADVEVYGTPASDRTALRALLDDVASLAEADHTPESWALLAEPLEQARRVEALAYPYQFQVDEAEEALAEVRDGLVRVPVWSRSATYTGGEYVTYDGRVYRASWWTQGVAPGSSPWGAWAELGATVDTAQGRVRTWTSSWIYDDGDRVVHDGRVWEARWWSRNQVPGTDGGPWRVVGAGA
ncbi:discoidin domain-containing protein [Isoptericola sp. NPDC057559]|uniref:discoidin domain-containing protein n=1 Tax=Isoptericola sp. NPDC057559 TaxID=3346168 RepID=UPI0036787E7C